MIDNTRPVVVVYRGGSGAVSIARTLGRLGVPVHLITQAGEFTPVSASRYWQSRTHWDFSRAEDESVDFLLAYGARLESQSGAKPLVLTLADWVAVFVERHRTSLADRFIFPTPARPVIRTLADKWGMHQLALESGIPTPMTAYPKTAEDARSFAAENGFPIVMKAADPFLPHAPGMRIAASERELMAHVQADLERGPLNIVLQEYIPGGPDSVWMCNGYFADEPARSLTFTGKKLRQVSPTGIACLAVCLPNPVVAEQTRRLMGAVGYRGCVGIGYRYDSRDGLYKLLDVNARVSGVFRLFAGTNGVDVVRACYLDMTGQDIPSTSLRDGRKWMLESDVVAAFNDVRAGLASVGDWRRSVRGVQELHWAAPDDPGPLIAWLGHETGRRALARIRRVRLGEQARST